MAHRIDPQLIPPQPDLSFESSFWEANIHNVVGIDEAGRGALAGPVAAGAVLLPPDPAVNERLRGVQDSKQLSPAKRETYAQRIRQVALAWGVGYASPQEIDHLGIVPAIRLASQRALEKILPTPQHLLLDYLHLPDNSTPQTWLIKGDARSLSIAAASILAKTIRDSHLVELGEQYPEYHLASNKGYGTQDHRAALQRYGPCPIHRLSYAPMRRMKGN